MPRLWQLAFLLAPIIITNGAWVVRNGLVMERWEHTERASINMLGRVDNQGKGGSMLKLTRGNVIAKLEEFRGEPLPAEAKQQFEAAYLAPLARADAQQRQPIITQTEIIMPPMLEPYVWPAIGSQVMRHFGNFWGATLERLWLYYKDPVPSLKFPLFSGTVLRRVLQYSLVEYLLLAFTYPLRWHNGLLFIGALLALLPGTRRELRLTVLLAFAFALYNGLTMALFMPIANVGYIYFSWPANALVAAFLYALALERLGPLHARFAQWRARRQPTTTK